MYPARPESPRFRPCGPISGRTSPPNQGTRDDGELPTHRIARSLRQLIENGVKVHIVEEDVAERELERSDLIEGLSPVSRKGVAQLLADYDHVWAW